MKNNEFIKIDSQLLGSPTSSQTATANVDTLGFDDALVVVTLGTTNVVSNVPTVLKLAECDTTVVSSFSDITEFVGGGTGGFTIPTNMYTSAENKVAFKVDLRGKKRYLRLSVTPATAQSVNCVTILGRPRQPVSTATERGTLAFVVA